MGKKNRCASCWRNGWGDVGYLGNGICQNPRDPRNSAESVASYLARKGPVHTVPTGTRDDPVVIDSGTDDSDDEAPLDAMD